MGNSSLPFLSSKALIRSIPPSQATIATAFSQHHTATLHRDLRSPLPRLAWPPTLLQGLGPHAQHWLHRSACANTCLSGLHHNHSPSQPQRPFESFSNCYSRVLQHIISHTGIEDTIRRRYPWCRRAAWRFSRTQVPLSTMQNCHHNPLMI